MFKPIDHARVRCVLCIYIVIVWIFILALQLIFVTFKINKLFLFIRTISGTVTFMIKTRGLDLNESTQPFQCNLYEASLSFYRFIFVI